MEAAHVQNCRKINITFCSRLEGGGGKKKGEGQPCREKGVKNLNISNVKKSKQTLIILKQSDF